MALSSWWKADTLTDLTPLPDFYVVPAGDDTELARLNKISIDEINARRQAGHRPYVGYVGQTPVTYGWVATREASIGELNLEFSIPEGERYLWDFATKPEWQGKGLYPRLLQAIIRAEEAERYWIIYAPENLPSGAGMYKAGFQPVGQLSFRSDGRVGLIPTGIEPHERAVTGAMRLGVPLGEEGLSPCWGCMEQLVCRCKLNPDECSCAVVIHSHH